MKDKISEAFDGLVEKLMGWLDIIIQGLPNLVLAIIVLMIAYFLAKYTSKIVKRIVSNRVSQVSITNIVSKLSAVLVVVAGIFLALGILDLSKTLTGLITGAGVLGLVIGLALQGTLSNTISGIVISFREKIRIGDWVETHDFSGEIVDINLNNFVLKQTDNNIVIIPNKNILESPLKNYTLTPHIRCELDCGVSYGSDLEFVEKLTLETLEKTFKRIDDSKPAEFFFMEFGDSSINFRCRFWIEGTRNVHKLIASNKAIIAIKKAFDANGINIPFPIRTLEFNNNLKMQSIGGTAQSSASKDNSD